MERTMLVLLAMVATHVLILSSMACPQQCYCSGTRVDCSRRQLQVIPDGIPENVVNLDLRDNLIIDVEAGKLMLLQSLETLSLQMNRLQKIKSYTFVNLTRLTRLHMANNEIETIEENAFQGLPSLKDLDLTDNKLSDITGKFHIARLQRLILSHNQISALQDDTLNSVRSLHYLLLSNNKISYISKSALDGMADLTYLSLNGNPIINVDNIFGAVQLMSYLDVSACHLTHIPKGLPWPLRYLKISDNNLTMIQAQDLHNTRYLAHLIADNNQIQTIQDGALLYTPYLTQVNVSYNKMKWLPQIPNHIETLNADNNEILLLHQSTFAHESSMKILSLGNNNISEIPPNTFSRLSNLNVLNLGHNKIKHLQNMSYAGPRQLTTLNLEFNPLEKIDYRAFGGLQKLEKLNLSNINSNQTAIEGAIFQDVPSLASLYLQSSPSIINSILNSWGLLRSLRNIQHLYLTNGSLQTISMDVKQFLPHLKSIHLSDNPWHCDRELVGLRNWMNETPELFADSSVKCASPEHLQGRAVQDISIEELTMAPPTKSTYLLSHSSEIIPSILTPLGDIMSQSEAITSSKLGEGTQLFQQTSTSVIQVTRSENVDITPLLQASDTATVNTTPLLQSSGLEVATSAYHVNNLSKGQQQELISTTLDHFHTPEISQRSPNLTPVPTELNQQEFPSTAAQEMPLMPGKVTSSGQLLTSDVDSSAMYTWPDNQMPANSAPSEASSTSGSYAAAHTPSTAPHSNSILSTITSQTTSSITSTFTVIPTSDIKILPALNSRTDASEDSNKEKQPHQISTSQTLPLTTSSTFTMGTTLSVTHLVLPTSNPPTTTTSVLNNTPTTITPGPIAMTLEPSTTDSLTQTRTPQLPTCSASRTETLSSIPGSEFVNEEAYTGITSVTGNTAVPVIKWAVPDMTKAVPDTTQIAPSPTQAVCDSEQALSDDSNGSDSNSHNKGDSRKPAAKPDNRLPTFSSTTDMKLRAIIITVSTTLLAVIIGLFVAIIIIKYRKRHKHVSFDDITTNITDVQTETSDTVFIISHMEGGHNLNSDTARDGKTSTSSTKDTSKVENGSKPAKKSSKFGRQSVSAVISKTKFDCIKGQTEDDSELLMYSWT